MNILGKLTRRSPPSPPNQNDQSNQANQSSSSSINLDALYKEGIDLINQAINAEDQYKFDDSLTLYGRGLDCLMTCLRGTVNQTSKQRLTHVITQYMNRAEAVKSRKSPITQSNRSSGTQSANRTSISSANSRPGSANQTNNTNQSTNQSNNQSTAVSSKESILQSITPSVLGVDQSIIDVLKSCVINQSNNQTTFDSIVGLEATKSRLYESCILPVLRPDLFSGIRRQPPGVLLYGPPGTGKTMLAKAVCNEASRTSINPSNPSSTESNNQSNNQSIHQSSNQSNITFFNVSASIIVSKNFGEGEKIVRALFVLANLLAPSIIFIDEIDSIASKRSSEEHEASRRLKTELFIQMDGLTSNQSNNQSNNQSVLVIAATNLPEALDEALLRRLPVRIYLPPPDQNQRAAMIQRNLQTIKQSINQSEIDQIASMTEGFSSSDLTALCSEAAMNPLREIGVSNLLSTPSHAIPPVRLAHFTSALKNIRPSVSKQSMLDYERFYRQQQQGV